jgi:transcriptional regulator with XRE-family HTH domain
MNHLFLICVPYDQDCSLMTDTVAKQMGERIRIAREQLGITQTQLADRLGKTQNTISNYENGNRVLRADELPQLAAILEVKIEYFYDETIRDDHFVDTEMRELIQQLTPPFRMVVLVYIRQQLKLQEQLLYITGKVDDDTLEKASNLIKKAGEKTVQETNKTLAHEILRNVFKHINPQKPDSEKPEE